MVTPLTPATNGLDNGLVGLGSDTNDALHSTGVGANKIVSALGSIASGLGCGLGETLADVPKALYGLLSHLDKSNSIIAKLLNSLV